MMQKTKLRLLALAVCVALAGCQADPAPSQATTTVPPSSSTTQPTQPPLKSAGYLTALEVDFYGFFIANVTVTYNADSLTQTYTTDGTTYQNTYDYQGRLLRQRMDSESFWSEETRTYQGEWTTPLTVTYTREGFTSTVERTFDENGHVLTKHYSASDDSWNTTVNTYDENGNRLTEKYTSSGGSDTLLTNTYDENGLLVHEVTLNKGEKTREVTHKYDEKGRVIQDYVWRYEPSKDFTYTSTTDFTLDAQGNILTMHQQDLDGYWCKVESTYNTAGKLLTENRSESGGYTASTENTYDESGNLIASTEIFGTQRYTCTYEYNAAGLQTKSVTTDPEGRVETVTSRYDENGNLLERVTTDPEGVSQKEVRGYDPYGNLVSFTAYNADEVTSRGSYTYTYQQLPPAQAEEVAALMQTLFVEFWP